MCPHFGLMDEAKMSKEEALLLRCKLHWRSGVKRLLNNETSSGLATVYDAMLSAMRWYILVYLHRDIGENGNEKLENERFVFSLLRRSGVIDETFDLKFIEETIDRALLEEEVGDAQQEVLGLMTSFLTQIGILPIDESELPPEKPETFF